MCLTPFLFVSIIYLFLLLILNLKKLKFLRFIGIKTGTIIQFFLYSGVANMATQNRSLAIISSLLYFQMKYFVSSGITKDVCFE